MRAASGLCHATDQLTQPRTLFWLGTVVVGIAAWSMICIGRREGLVPKPDANRERSGDSN